MNLRQRSMLIFSIVFYILTLCGLLFSLTWIVIPAFVLHSILLTGFAYSVWQLWQDSLSNHEQEPQTSESFFLTEKLTLAEKRREELAGENARLAQELAVSRTACEELRSKVEELALPAELPEEAPDAASAASAYNYLLPPPDENGTQTINIIQVAKDVIEHLAPYSRKAGIEIKISSVTDTLLVKADTNRIRVLFLNIIDNSIKYMNRSGNLIITMSTLGDDIFIVLKDNGNGLETSEVPHIFELNYQGSNRISGNGLGLTQAMAIVNSYGGTIYAKSTLGKGMGIYIQIPIE